MEKFSVLVKILTKLFEQILYLGLKGRLWHISGGAAARRSSAGFGAGTFSAS